MPASITVTSHWNVSELLFCRGASAFFLCSSQITIFKTTWIEWTPSTLLNSPQPQVACCPRWRTQNRRSRALEKLRLKSTTTWPYGLERRNPWKKKSSLHLEAVESSERKGKDVELLFPKEILSCASLRSSE